jgi:predicted XRE-type DNA-binding protein
LLTEKGQIGNSLQDISLERRNEIEQRLALREKMGNELLAWLDKSLFEIKKISSSYENAAND